MEKSLKQQAGEELLELLDDPRSGLRDSSDTNKTRHAAIGLLEETIDRTIAACIAKVPKKSPDWYKEGNWNYCRTLMLEGLKELET